MKKLAALTLVLGMAFSFTACGSGDDTNTSVDSPIVSEESQQTETTTVQTVSTGYTFRDGNYSFFPDQDMDAAAMPPEVKSVFEAPSCAGQGTAYIYDFGSYEIETYPAADGKNVIGFITLKDDMVQTAEGIDLSKSREDIIAAYGNDYEEDAGKITYKKGNMKLNFVMDGDSIISIEYVSAVIG